MPPGLLQMRRLQEDAPAEQGFDPLTVMGAFSKLRFVHEVRYRTIEEVANAAQGLPPFDAVLDGGRGAVAMMPPDLLNAMKELSTFADGLDTVELTGLPKNYVINVKFTNFHLTPVLKSLIDEAAPPEDGEPVGELPEELSE